jgi:hypothetical protein
MSLKLSALASVLPFLASLAAASSIAACGAPADPGASDVAAKHGAASTEFEIPAPPEPPIPIRPSPDAGVDAAPVVPPPGLFACGPLNCDIDTQYCRHIIGGAVPPIGTVQSWRFECPELPPACLEDVECKCLPRFVGEFCSAGPTGGLTVLQEVPGPLPGPVPVDPLPGN